MKKTSLWQFLSNTPISAWRHLIQKAQLYKELFLCPTTPWLVKTLMVIAALYLLMPIDLIPDTIPILGLTDDFAIIGLILSYADRFITDEMYDKIDKRRDS